MSAQHYSRADRNRLRRWLWPRCRAGRCIPRPNLNPSAVDRLIAVMRDDAGIEPVTALWGWS